jgi:hypothetical protein
MKARKKLSFNTATAFALLCVLATLGMLIGVAISAAQNRSSAVSCSSSNHHHRYADLKLALVEIKERDECGFRFDGP